MTRETESLLLDFCVQQRARFAPAAWMNFPRPADEKATVALFLANTPEFGHSDELLDLAEQLHRGCVGHFTDMARRTEFSPSRFRGLLKAMLAHEQSVR